MSHWLVFSPLLVSDTCSWVALLHDWWQLRGHRTGGASAPGLARQTHTPPASARASSRPASRVPQGVLPQPSSRLLCSVPLAGCHVQHSPAFCTVTHIHVTGRLCIPSFQVHCDSGIALPLTVRG